MGGRLRALRRARGFSRREAAAEAGISRRALAAWERGSAPPSEDILRTLARVYEVEPVEIMPQRPQSSVRVEGNGICVGGVERRLRRELDPEEVLEKYLDAVYELRGSRPGNDLALRDADLADLADVLGGTPDEIEHRLVQLIACTRAEARALRRALLKRRLAVPAAGVALGLGGMAPAVAGAGRTAAPEPDPAHTSSVEEVVEQAPPETVVPPVGDGPSEVEPPAPPVVDPPPPSSSPVPAPHAEDPVVDEPVPDDDWAELIPPQIVERDEDWAELAPAQVIELDEEPQG